MLYDVDVVFVTEQKGKVRVEADTKTNAKKAAAAGVFVEKTVLNDERQTRITPYYAVEADEPTAAGAAH